MDWIRRGVRIPFIKGRPPPSFNHGISLEDATPEQLAFVDQELERFQLSGAWEAGSCDSWVSRCFLVPKTSGWRLIIDLRELNDYCQKKKLKFETLKTLKHLARPDDWWFSFDLQDGFYALGIAPEDRKYFTVNIRGKLFQLAGLPMGWTLSPYIFHHFCDAFVRFFRTPTAAQGCGQRVTRRQLRKGRRGLRLLPFVDDFAFISSSEQQARQARDYVLATLRRLGLAVHPDKGYQEPVQEGQHLGIIVDLKRGEFRAPAAKLSKIAGLAKSLLYTASSSQRWLPVKLLAQLAGSAQFLYLAIPQARYYLRELHDVVSTKCSWSGRVRMTKQLRRDLLWWTSVPSCANGQSIFKPVETAYLHCDSSSFGWGGVLNEHLEARGFWYGADKQQHITWKELKAVRLTVETFLPLLRGRRVLLHEDNQAVVAVLTHLTSRSPVMMTELRKLHFLLDTNSITVRPQYIRTTANVWADRLSRELDRSDWQFSPRLFRHLSRLWGPHTVDRFSSRENALLPRYNARWGDPTAEAVDCLHLDDHQWRVEANWCHPPWELLDDLVTKLHRSGAPATVIAPWWPGKAWHQRLCELAEEVIVYPPAFDLFSQPGRPAHVEGGMTAWSVGAFKVPSRAGSV